MDRKEPVVKKGIKVETNTENSFVLWEKTSRLKPRTFHWKTNETNSWNGQSECKYGSWKQTQGQLNWKNRSSGQSSIVKNETGVTSKNESKNIAQNKIGKNNNLIQNWNKTLIEIKQKYKNYKNQRKQNSENQRTDNNKSKNTGSAQVVQSKGVSQSIQQNNGWTNNKNRMSNVKDLIKNKTPRRASSKVNFITNNNELNQKISNNRRKRKKKWRNKRNSQTTHTKNSPNLSEHQRNERQNNIIKNKVKGCQQLTQMLKEHNMTDNEVMASLKFTLLEQCSGDLDMAVAIALSARNQISSSVSYNVISYENLLNSISQPNVNQIKCHTNATNDCPTTRSVVRSSTKTSSSVKERSETTDKDIIEIE